MPPPVIFADDKGIGLKGWLAGPKSKSQQTEKKQKEHAQFDRNRLVVLPFKSMSPDPNDEYFADGMTEELITALSGIKDLDVIARTTAMLYKGASKRVSTIGKELNSNSLIEGSIRKVGNKVRISVQLIGTQNESHIWAQNYDKQLDDIFAVQTDIAERVTDALKVKLLPSEKQELERPVAQNLNAYTLYLRGRYLWSKRSKESMMEALACFTQAVEIDPSFALGYSGLADCHTTLAAYGLVDRTSNFDKARTYASKALDTDGKLAEAHVSLAGVLEMSDFNYAGAEEELKKAIALKPSYATAHQWYAGLLMFQERFDEAFAEFRRALDLDPLSLKINSDFGVYLETKKEYDKAIEQYKKVLQVAPDFFPARAFLSRAYCLNQMYDEAFGVIPEEGIFELGRAYVYASMGNAPKALSLLADVEGPGKSELMVGIIYILLHEFDKGFEWLDQAVDKHDPLLFMIKIAPEFDAVRSDPRYHALLRKVNLE